MAVDKIDRSLVRTLRNDWEKILDSTHNGIVAVDSLGIVVVFNTTAEKMLRMSKEQTLGRHIREVIPNTGLLRVLQTGKPETGEKFTVNGMVVLTNRTPVIDKGEVVAAIAVFQDITELHKIAEELTVVKQIKSTLEAVLENSNEGTVVIDQSGVITMYNRAYAEFLNVDRTELLGRRIAEVVENTRLHLILETGEPEVGDVQRLKGHDIVTTRVPIKKDGQIVGAVGKIVFRDVSELNALARKVNLLHNQVIFYKDELQRVIGAKYNLDNIIGVSRAIIELKESLKRSAQSNSTVLIRGESGTGKEYFAHALHNESLRCFGPFVKVNCAALPESILESELFGYEEGAFTGAKKGGQAGKFELADKGTIFLDEIGDMPYGMQAKLLRVLQEKEFERVGGGRTKKLDVRVIAATNKDLEELMRKKLFREDLFYRLNVVTLHIPPLRERMEDLQPLLESFIAKFNHEFGFKVSAVSPQAMAVLRAHNWPGNVRELENVVERAFNVLNGESIEVHHLPKYLHRVTSGVPFPVETLALKTTLENAEKEVIANALIVAGGNKRRAAKLLGISRAALYQKLEKYGIG